MNISVIVGRLAGKPRRNDLTRQNGEKVSRCFFTVLTDNGKDSNGNQRKPTAFPVSCTGKMADTILQYKDTGDLVSIYAEYSPYTDKPHDKTTRQPLENAYDVTMPMFRLVRITFLANGKNHQNQQSGDNPNMGAESQPDLGTYQHFGDGNMQTSDFNSNIGDIPFPNDEEDPFGLSQMP